MGTLVVIDMQPYFGAANQPRILRACKREIRLAMQREHGIILVRYANCGPIHPELCDLVKLYRRHKEVQKGLNNGSGPIYAAMLHHGFDLSPLRICGVNANACVHSTISGLRRTLPNSEFIAVADAINYNGSRGDEHLSDNLKHRKRLLEWIDDYGVQVENRHLLVRHRKTAA